MNKPALNLEDFCFIELIGYDWVHWIFNNLYTNEGFTIQKNFREIERL